MAVISCNKDKLSVQLQRTAKTVHVLRRKEALRATRHGSVIVSEVPWLLLVEDSDCYVRNQSR